MASINVEEATHSSIQEPIIDPQTNHARTQLPSSVVAPTRTDTLPQQGSTQPGDGSGIHARHSEPDATGGPSDHNASTAKVPFKEQVLGVAKKTRGTLLGKPELKEHGEMILEGKATAHEDPTSTI